MPEHEPVFRNVAEIDAIKAIAASGSDRPVLMLNLNRYTAEAGYPDGDLYRQYMSALTKVLPNVGGKVLWQSPVHGQPVGEQPVDEVLAAWYPSHQAFLDLPNVTDAEENFRLRRLIVEYAVIHRCDGELAPLGGE